MNQQLSFLVEQFKNAVDTMYMPKSEEEPTFIAWLNERKLIGEIYLSMLDYMGIAYNNCSCAEIGKSKDDTLVEPFQTKIITPFTKGLEERKGGEVIKAGFRVYSETKQPTLVKNELGDLDYQSIDASIVKTYMTQNPYTDSHLANWQWLHNSNKYNMIVGVYGNVHDHDMKQKIEELKHLRDQLLGNYREEYSKNGDVYCYAIASEGALKEHILTKKITIA